MPLKASPSVETASSLSINAGALLRCSLHSAPLRQQRRAGQVDEMDARSHQRRVAVPGLVLGQQPQRILLRLPAPR